MYVSSRVSTHTHITINIVFLKLCPIYFRTLQVLQLTSDDSGQYKCQARTRDGATSPVVTREVSVERSDQVVIGQLEFQHGGHRIVQPRGVTTTR